MSRSDRLFSILQILRDGSLHTADALADRLGVSVRTIYRDMETLQASGVPVEGERGVGYRATGVTTLPPLTLSEAELEALNLGIAIVAEAADPDLAAAAGRLGEKLDAVLPEQVMSAAESWKFALTPFADTARGVSHMGTIRGAIKARQKLMLDTVQKDGTRSTHRIRPLLLEHWGRIWTLTAWSEQSEAFEAFRVDLIADARALPELFTDEPGKTLQDYKLRTDR